MGSGLHKPQHTAITGREPQWIVPAFFRSLLTLPCSCWLACVINGCGVSSRGPNSSICIVQPQTHPHPCGGGVDTCSHCFSHPSFLLLVVPEPQVGRGPCSAFMRTTITTFNALPRNCLNCLPPSPFSKLLELGPYL